MRAAGAVVVALVCATALTSSRASAAGSGSLSCVATHIFSCDTARCERAVEVSNGSVRLYLDTATGIGQLCEYTQCRGLVAAFFGGAESRTAQVVLGPSSSVVHRSAAGEAIGDDELLPSLGGLLGLDAGEGAFLLSQQNGTSLSGYSGICVPAD
jgi:hypothetical protein